MTGGIPMKCQMLIDWLTFSIKNIQDPLEVIIKYLGLDPVLFQEAPYGLMGYQRCLIFSDIRVLYEPHENQYFHDMGVCVTMSGNGCRTFETMSKLTFESAKDRQGTESVACPVLFQLLAANENANISRIDAACDDREGYLCMGDIVRKVQDNEINSRMTKRTVMVSYDGAEPSGSTVYIGAPSSDFRIRIYDKALESGEDGHWVRVELVMRGKNANAFGVQLTNRLIVTQVYSKGMIFSPICIFLSMQLGAAGGIRIISWAENAVKWRKQTPLFATVSAVSVKIV